MLRSYMQKIFRFMRAVTRSVVHFSLRVFLFIYRTIRIIHKRYIQVYTPIILKAIRSYTIRAYMFMRPHIIKVTQLAWVYIKKATCHICKALHTFAQYLARQRYIKRGLVTLSSAYQTFTHTALGKKITSYAQTVQTYIQRHRLKVLATNAGVLALVAVLAVGGVFNSFAATNTWEQSNWSGGVGTNTNTQFASQTNIDFSTTGEVSASANDWYDTDWSYRKAITIDSANVSGSDDLYNYPLYIDSIDTDWRTRANGGLVEQSDGGDIVFSDATGTKIDHVIETYTASTGELQAWVRVPVLGSDDDTVIYIYYGNDAGGLDESDQTGNIMTSWDFDGNDDYIAIPNIKKSLELDGTDDYMSIADDDSLSFGDGTTDSPFSISTYVFLDDNNANNQGFIGKKNLTSGFDAEYGLQTNASGHIAFTLLDKSASAFISRKNNSSLALGRWYHIVGTYDGSGTTAGIKIYADGVRIDSIDDGGGTYTAMENTANPVGVGNAGRSTTYMKGNLDKSIIWNKELSAAEVTELYVASSVDQHSAYTDVVSWYDFEDADVSGTTVSDRKANNDGILTNGATNNAGGIPSPLSFGDGATDEPFSISTWASMNDATWFPLVGKYNMSSGDLEYLLYTDNSDNMQAVLYDSSGSSYIRREFSTPITSFENQPTLFGMTYDGSGTPGGIKLYINGTQVDNADTSSGSYTAMGITDEPVRIGRTFSGGVTQYANGTIGEAIIWDTELSDANMVSIFNNGQPRLEENESLASDIISGWRARGSTTGTGNVADLIGNNDATLNGGLSANDIVYRYPHPLPTPSNSLDFNGSNEYIEVFSNETVPVPFQSIAESFGVSFFFQQDITIAGVAWTPGNTVLELRQINGSSTKVPFSIGISDLGGSSIQLGVTDNYTTNAETVSSGVFTTNAWKHGVVNVDGDDWEIWLDGEKSSGTFTTATGDRNVGTVASSLTIGARRRDSNAVSNLFDGNLSQLLIKGEPFTKDQVIELYNDGTPRETASLSSSNNFLATYNLDGDDDYTMSNGVVDDEGGYDGTALSMDSGNIQVNYPTAQNSVGTTDWNTTISSNLSAPGSFYAITDSVNTAELISASFDTGDADTIIGDITWSETVSGSDVVKFQMRTAPDIGGSPGTWTSWLGPTNSSDYYTTSAGGNTINSTHSDATDDQWVQYNMNMEFQSLVGPTVEDVTITYVANEAPDFNNDFPTAAAGGVSASQASSGGTVDISYSVRDIDTTTGSNTPGFITPSFEYSTDGGSSWTSINNANLAASDVATKSVDEVSYTTHTATWDAASTLNAYTTEAQIRVTADDGEGGNNTNTASSQDFILDSSLPTVNTFSVDASTSPASLSLSCSDDTGLQMQYGVQSDLSDGSYGAYATTATLSGVEGGDIVYLQCQDAYGNESLIESAEIPSTPANLFYQDISNPSASDYRLFIAWSVVAEPTPGFANYKIYRSTDGSNYSLHQTITNRSTNFVIDDGLSTGTIYYYRLTTTDDDGNVSSYSDIVSDNPDAQGGSDLTAPSISNITESALNATGITIEWNTDELSNSTVYFEATSTDPGTTPGNYSSSQGVPSFVTDNTVSLSNLIPGTEYYYLITSSDPSGNTGIANVSGSFTTNAGPVISNVSAPQVFNDQATITWSTDGAADTTVYYSENSDLSSATQLGSSDDVTEHAVNITGLTNGTKYYFYVESEDTNSNITIDKNIVDGEVRYYSFTTTSDAIDPVISNVSAALTGETGATIAWTTDEGSTSQVEWGEDQTLGTLTTQTSVYTTQHAVTLTGLSNDSVYYYRVISEDRAGNSASDNNGGNTYSFNTLEPSTRTVTNTRIIEKDDEEGPVITNINISPIGQTRARVTFETDEVATSGVGYGQGNMDTSIESTTYAFTHTIVLEDLVIGSEYQYAVNATDADGNETTSSAQNFVHQEPLNTEDLALSNETRDLLTTLAQAGTYDEANTLAQQAFAALTAAGINISGGLGDGEGAESGVEEFAILNPQLSNIGARSATLTYRTTQPARTAIEVINLATNEIQRFEDTSYLNSHTLEMTTLEEQTSYSARITAEDEEGATVTSSLIPFSTSADTASLELFDVQTNSTLIPGRSGKVQTIVSWRTNKPSTSQIYFGIGATAETLNESTVRNQSYVTEHVVIMSDFNPGTIYRVQAESTDRQGDTQQSEQYSLLTPRNRQNIVDVIIENVQDTFGVFGG